MTLSKKWHIPANGKTKCGRYMVATLEGSTLPEDVEDKLCKSCIREQAKQKTISFYFGAIAVRVNLRHRVK